MEITYGKIIESYPVFNKIGDMEFQNGEIALQLAFLIAEINKYYHEYSTLEMKIVEEHCEKWDNGAPRRDERGNFRLLEGHKEEADKAMAALVNTTVTIDDHFFINKEWLKDMKLTPIEAFALQSFIR